MSRKVIKEELFLLLNLHFSQPACNYSITFSQVLSMVSSNLLKDPGYIACWANWKEAIYSSIYEWGHILEKHKILRTSIESSVNAKSAHIPNSQLLGTLNNRKNMSNITTKIQDVSVAWNMHLLKHTHNASLWVPLASVAECGCKGGRAALIIQGGASIIDGWVDGDCPHTRGITIAVAVVIATTISWCPHVDATFSSSPLEPHHHPSYVKICQVSSVQVGLPWVKWGISPVCKHI